MALALSSCVPGGQFAVNSPGGASGPLTITDATLPKGFVGQPFYAQLTALGGSRPYTWSVFSGELPAGLSLDPETGVIAGTPTQAEKFTFTACVRDSSLLEIRSALATLSSEIATTSLTILTRYLPPAYRGFSYQIQFAASGGTPPYTWSIVDGSLPPGLELDPLSGKVTGVPIQEGRFSFSVQAADSGSPPATVIACLGGNGAAP
jgi:hypothetical protein